MIAQRNKRQALAEINNNFTPLRNIDTKHPQTPINLLDVNELKTPQNNCETNCANSETINHLQQLLQELLTSLNTVQNEKKTLKSVQTQTFFCKASMKSNIKVSIKKTQDEKLNDQPQTINEENDLKSKKNLKNPKNLQIQPKKQVLFNGSPRKNKNSIYELNDNDIDQFDEDSFNFSKKIEEFTLNLRILEAQIDEMYGSNYDFSSS